MNTRTYGYRYSDTADVTTIAAAMRRDIKAAIKDGLLPTGKYRVRTHRYAGGQSINIAAVIPAALRDCDGQVYATWFDGQLEECSWCRDELGAHRVLTEDAAVAKMTLDRIHGAYNHDGSDTAVDYFDVRYYGDVVVGE